MTTSTRKSGRTNRLLHREFAHWQLYLLALPAIIYILVFCYKPMYGIVIAFKNFTFRGGIWGSKWVGLYHFKRLFASYWFPIILRNTLTLSLLSILITFPVPIVLALMVNEVSNARVKKLFQTVSYAPHFISTVVMCGMVILFLKPTSGLINNFLAALGQERVYFMQNPAYFKWIYVLSDVWQNTGWNAIIYFSALAGIDPSLYEAAMVDGAGRMQRIWHITLPNLIPTFFVLLIISIGNFLNTGIDQYMAFGNALNKQYIEVLDLYTYNLGIGSGQISFGVAVGIMKSVVALVLFTMANTASKKVRGTSVF